MRVTNSMLVSNFLNNLNNNLGNISKLQTQLATGRKYASISDDPISTVYSLQARFRLERLDNFQKSVKSAQSWLTQAETSAMDLNEVYKSAYESVIGASTNVLTDEDRNNMAAYIGQLRDHLLQTLNTSYGNKYVFSGYDTTGYYPDANQLYAPYQVDADTGHLWLNGLDLTAFVTNYDDSYDPAANPPGSAGYDATKAKAAAQVAFLADQAATKAAGANYDPAYAALVPPPVLGDDNYDAAKEAAVADYNTEYQNFMTDYDANYATNTALYDRLHGEVLQFSVGTGLKMDVVLNGIDLTGTGPDNLYTMLDRLYNDLKSGASVEDIQHTYISQLQNTQSGLLAKAAELGGLSNRLDMLTSRYEADYLNYTQVKSDAEDADYAELIMNFQMAMNVYNAALSAGSTILQKSLVDFLR